MLTKFPIPEAMPDKINIMGYIYDVKYCDNKFEVNQEKEKELLGEVNFDHRRIGIFNNNKSFDMWQIVWHEVFHIFARIFHLDNESVKEEDNDDLKRQKAKFIEDAIDACALGVTKICFDNKLNFTDRSITTLPKHLLILGYDYDIHYFNDLKKVSPDKKYTVEGCANFQNQTMRIFDNGKIFPTWQILWHEIFHKIIHIENLDMASVEEDKDDDLKLEKAKYVEAMTDKFGLGTINVLFDNKLDYSRIVI